MQPTITLPKAEAPKLPLPAQAAVDQRDGRTAVVGSNQTKPSPHAERWPEADEIDRAFHATVARFTGGISPVALLLAYTDWVSHMAAAPQRQMEIILDAMQSVHRFFQASLRYFSADQVADQATAVGSAICQARMGEPAVQLGGAIISADRAMVA